MAAGETPALPGPQSSFLATSAKTGAGIADLASAMAEAALGTPATGEESALVAGERHARQIESARQSAEAARDAAAGGASPAIVALELDDALRALSELLGETTPDDVLDHIFARFCIGK
ncbi:hypothetical protein K8I61_01645 [bacterium]|nr:hypothetical protein [bacterium]